MIAEGIYDFIGGIGDEGLIWGVLAGVLVLFVLGLLGAIHRPLAASLMTSLGIFGTFCGVFIALYPLDFSPDKMSESIQSLLQGMTAAFVTSLIGLAGSIFSRFFWSFFRGDSVEDNLNDLVANIQRILDSIPTTMDNLKESAELVNAQINQLNKAMETFGEMKKQAKEALPEIAQGLKKINENLNGTVQKLETIHTEVEQAKDDVAEVGKAWGESAVAIAQRCREVIDQQERR